MSLEELQQLSNLLGKAIDETILAMTSSKLKRAKYTIDRRITILNRKCEHLNHDQVNEFIGQSFPNKEGNYIMLFNCAKCSKTFRTHNNIMTGLISVSDSVNIIEQN